MDHTKPVSFSQQAIRVLNSEFIKAHVPMKRAIELMEVAFPMLSDGAVHIPARIVTPTPDGSMSVFYKPAFVSRYNRMSIKLLTQTHSNPDQDNPTIKGLVLLIDIKSGSILSLCDGISITALRTGAASGIATSCLANPGASTVAVFGCGAQGKTQLEAMLAVRPVRKVLLFDLAEKRISKMMDEANLPTGISCEINPDLEILKTADIICTATPSQKPLFGLRHLKPGVHINAVGSYRPDMTELDAEVLKAGLVYLDDARACLKDSGDLLMPLSSGAFAVEDIIGELGQLIAGSIKGRQSETDITIFKSVGNAIQDFFVANEAYEKSLTLEHAQSINLG